MRMIGIARRGMCMLASVSGNVRAGCVSAAQGAFENVWTRLEESGIPLVFPKEIIWLNGAPGSGKTLNSRFMMETRGFGHSPIVVSQVLSNTSSKARAAIECGRLVDDETVLESLFQVLLQPKHRSGALVDGFPRTASQVECLPLLRDKMRQLRAQHVASNGVKLDPRATRFIYPVPRFFVCILYVGKEESIRRQVLRGEHAQRHNIRVRMTGTGTLVEERATDFDRHLIEQRYEIFEQHRGTLLALQHHFPFSVIDSECPVPDVQLQILKQFRYQSNQELRSSTFATIDKISLANKLRFNARDKLVTRLDEYGELHPRHFEAVVQFVKSYVVPACRNAAFSGVATIRLSPDHLAHPDFERLAFPQMVIDVLAERGYTAEYSPEEHFVPVKFAKDTGEIICERRVTHLLRVTFPKARLTASLSELSKDVSRRA